MLVSNPKATCKTCPFWSKKGISIGSPAIEDKKEVGRCLRYPPSFETVSVETKTFEFITFENSRHITKTLLPVMTTESETCGEHPEFLIHKVTTDKTEIDLS